MNYVAIDPGLKGAIALLGIASQIEIHDVPVIKITTTYPRRKPKTKTLYNVVEMARLIHRIRQSWMGYEITWLIENVHSVPGFRSSPGASLDRAMGIWEGIFGSIDIELVYVLPKDWKEEFSLMTMDKKASIYVARKLFPAANLMRPRARTYSADRADALLIAEYGRRTHDTS